MTLEQVDEARVKVSNPEWVWKEGMRLAADHSRPQTGPEDRWSVSIVGIDSEGMPYMEIKSESGDVKVMAFLNGVAYLGYARDGGGFTDSICANPLPDLSDPKTVALCSFIRGA